MKFVFDRDVGKSRIARKLIALIIGFSALIALVTTGFQLSIDYRRDVKKIKGKIEEIRTAQLDTLRYSIWNLDEENIRILLDSMLKIGGIEYLKVTSDQNTSWEAGRIESEKIISETIPIYHVEVGKMLIGEFEVVAGLDPVYRQLIHRALIILASNAVKTFLVAFFALVVFQMLVSRHLHRIASYVSQMGSDNYEKELFLDGKKTSFEYPDEIDRIATAINSMRLEQKTLVDGLKDEIKIRKQAEETLQASEEDLKESQRIAHVGSWRLDVSSNQVVWSEELYKMYGFDPALPPPPYTEHQKLFTPESWDRLSAALNNTRDKGIPYELELETVREDGSHGWMWVHGEAVLGSRGVIIGLRGAAQDITERKQAEKALHESEERLRLSTELANVAVWEYDFISNRMSRSDNHDQLYGLERQAKWDINTFINATHPDDREVSNAIIQKSVSLNGPDQYTFDFRVVFPDQSIHWLMVTGQVIERDSEGKGTIVRGCLIDITDRKHAEIELRLYEHIVSNTNDMLALIDRNFVYLAANAAYLEAFAKTSDEVIGRRVAEVLGEDFFSTVVRPMAERCMAGENIRYHDWFELPAAGRRYMDVAYFPYRGPGAEVRGVVVTVRDNTDYKNLQAQLLQTQKIESIGSLAGGVAHEINNPINGIMNYAQLIMDKIGDHPVSEFAGEIIRETERVATIVRNLLTFAREDKESHSPARIKDIVNDTMSLIQTVFKRDQISLEVDVPEDLPKIKCRSQQIQQVIMNLVTNARDALNLKYSGYDDNKLIKIISTSFETEGKRWIRTTVEDHGVGINPDIKERILDPFFTTKGRTSGTGLGLSISYGIVKDHHGELSFESEPGEYTRFHVDLPVENVWDLEKNANS